MSTTQESALLEKMRKLSVEQRIKLAGDIWDNIAESKLPPPTKYASGGKKP